MNELDSLMGSGEQPELSDLMPPVDYSIAPPKASIRNRAATLSLFSNTSEETVNKYKTMLAEGEQGSFAYTSFEQSKLADKMEAEDKSAVISILSDPLIKPEQKDFLVKQMQTRKKDSDPHIALLSEFSKQASQDETPEAEESRVGMAAKAIREMREANEQIQGIVNAHAASLDDASASTVLEIAEYLVAPFGTNIATSTLAGGVYDERTAWEKLKSFVLPGSEIKDLRTKLESLPAQERIAMAEKIAKALARTPKTVFGHNQFAAYDKALQVFGQGGYSTSDEWLDNIGGLLDAVGIGFLVKPKKAFKAPQAIPVPPTVTKAPTGPSKPSETPSTSPTTQRTPLVMEEDLATLSGKPTTGAYDARIAELERQKAELLGTAGNQLGKREVSDLQTERKAIVQSFEQFGTEEQLAKDLQKNEKITFKAAKEKAAKLYAERKQSYEASLARVDGMLDTNREASTVTQQVADLEKQIDMLKKRNTPVFVQKNPIADAIERMEKNVVRKENPLTPHATAKQTNPQKAREFHETIVKTQSDEVAEALTGEDVIQSVANDVFPQAATETGRVTAQAPDIQRNLRRAEFVPERVKEYIFSAGRMDITPEEAATARANVVRRFNDAEGLRMEDSMSSFTRDGGNIKISAMYGTSEGAFLSPTEAIAQAKAALKHMGLKDDEIVLMERQGRDYVPVDPNKAAPEGSYYVRIDTKHEIDPTDIVDKDGNVSFENFSVWGNVFDRLGVGFAESFGSLQRHILDAQSMLDKRLTGAASAASDRAANLEKFLLEEATRFSDKYRDLDKKQKLQLDLYLREANFKEIPFDPTDLMARGFTPKMIDTVKSWREYWDGVYYLENLDVIRTLRAQGFKRFKNTNADLYAKPVAKDKRNSYVYDPDSDTVVPITPDEMDDLYDMGGTIAKLRRPTDFGGETVEHIVVRNHGQSFLKDLRDSDTVLNYKEGYYNIQYNAPRFVDEVFTDPKTGREIRKAIAVAGDTLEAQRFADRMARNSTKGEKYVVRADDRAMRTGTDDWFDVSSAGGRIAQRHRGKLLEDGAGLNHLGDGSYIVDPVSSAIRAARSISGRTVTRPVLEYAKARFMKQYGKYVTESDGMGGKRFPSSPGSIGAKGMTNSKEVADARTTYEYIRYLENGYINGVDNFFKAFMHTLSLSVGKRAAKAGSKTGAAIERGLENLSEVRLAQAGKNFVFQAYIATNPLRQLIVQPHQVIRMNAYNPVGMSTGSIAKLVAEYTASYMTGKPNGFRSFIEGSGAMAAVDKQNLVRGSLFEAAQQSNKVSKKAAEVLAVPRVVGFDTGERMNMIGHYAAVYDKYLRDGKDLTDKTVIEEAYSAARALSYSMNFANDMPYNQNALGLVLQFMQVPHKAMLQMTSKALTKGERARLAGFDMLFWGGPTLLISELLGGDILPDNPELREAFVFGIESWLFNRILQNHFGDESINIDFSSLAPSDMTGWRDFFASVAEEGLLTTWSNSPAGQMFGDQGRVATAVRSVLRYVGVSEPMEETPEQFTAVLEEILSISSGFSNGMKAHLALKTGERYDKYGQQFDATTLPVEAVMEAFGFSDANRRDMFAVSRQIRKDTKAHRDETTRDVKILLDHLANRLKGGSQDQRQLEIIQRSMNFALSRYEGDPVAMDIFHQQLALRMRDPQDALAMSLLKAGGIPSIGNVKDQIRMAPLDEEQKKKMLQVIDDLETLRGEE